MLPIDRLFVKLHELHVNLMQNMCRQSICEYRDILLEIFNEEKPVNDETLDSAKFSDFLLFPLLTSLKKIENQAKKVREWSDLNEILIKSISLILNQFKLFNLNLFYEILNLVSLILSKKTNQKSTSENLFASDELLCASFELVQILFERSCSNRVLDSFYVFNNMTSLGFLVSMSLDLLCDSDSLEVRLAALNTLKSISAYKSFTFIATESIDYDARIGVLFASFLPGISIKLVQKFLLTQDLNILNHKVTCSLLDVLAHVIAAVLNDSLLDEHYATRCFNTCLNLGKLGKDGEKMFEKVNSLIVNRVENKHWLKETSEKMSILIERVLDALLTNDNQNVQFALVKFSYLISNRCYFSLNQSLSKFLKVLVTLASNDEESSVSRMAIESLKLMEAKELPKLKSIEETFLTQSRFSIVSSSMEEVMIKTPRLMKNKLESERVGHLKTLYGYLRLAGDYHESPDLNDFFYSNLNNLNQLLHGLVACVVFDYNSLSNFYESKSDMKSNTALSNYNGMETFLKDKTTFAELRRICEYLGRSSANRLLIDQLLTNESLLLQQKQNKLEIMFLVNLILTGLKNQQSPLIVKIVLSSFLNDYKESNEDQIELVEVLSIEEDGSKNESLTVRRNRLIINTCLILEAISTCGQCLTKDDFNSLLIDTLFFCLENYLSMNLCVKVVASKCLESLALNLGFNSVQSLLSSNYDYLMNDLILKSFEQSRRVKEDRVNERQASYVFVLCALMDIADADLVPYLERLVDDYFVLVELRSHHSDIIGGVCKIMQHMNKAMQRWHPVRFNFTSGFDEKVDRLTLDLREYSELKRGKLLFNSEFNKTLEEINKSLSDFEKIDENSGEENKEENEGEEEEEKKKIPLHVKIQCKCMELYAHLVSHPLKQVRISVFELIAGTSRNLAEHTDQFLPLVHKLWAPICQRFGFDDLLVKSRIVYLLFDLSVFCADFLSSRFRKEFLPRLCVFMNEQSKLSGKVVKNGSNSTPADPTYNYSHSFKLQRAVLANLPQMAVLFEIKELELEKLIESSILVYLDRSQPKALQSLALNAISDCALVDPDIVWLCLHYVLPFASLEQNDLFYDPGIKLKFNLQLGDEILNGLIQLFRNI